MSINFTTLLNQCEELVLMHTWPLNGPRTAMAVVDVACLLGARTEEMTNESIERRREIFSKLELI